MVISTRQLTETCYEGDWIIKVKLRKQEGKLWEMQRVTTLCQCQCGHAEVWAVYIWSNVLVGRLNSFIELFVLKHDIGWFGSLTWKRYEICCVIYSVQQLLYG